MSEGIIGSLIALVGLALSGLMVYLPTRAKNRTDRVSLLEKRVGEVEADFRVLEDYTGELRGLLRAAGLPVPQWPTELRD